MPEAAPRFLIIRLDSFHASVSQVSIACQQKCYDSPTRSRGAPRRQTIPEEAPTKPTLSVWATRDDSTAATCMRHPTPHSARLQIWILDQFLNSCYFLVQHLEMCKNVFVFSHSSLHHRRHPHSHLRSPLQTPCSLRVSHKHPCRTLGGPG